MPARAAERPSASRYYEPEVIDVEGERRAHEASAGAADARVAGELDV